MTPAAEAMIRPYAGGATASVLVRHTGSMGFDATRKQVRRKSDFIMVVVALLVCAALVAWAFLG